MTAPNVLLITVDSLRADHVFSDQSDMPAIDELRGDATVASEAIAQGPFTTFSMPSLFTSKYPSQLTGIDFVEGVEGVLVDGAETLQKGFKKAGYRTAGIHSNPLLSEAFGFDVGFDHFYDDVDTLSNRAPERLTLLVTKLNRMLRKTAYLPGEKITDRAVAWLNENDDEPFLLWVHYMDVHGPYQPKDGWSYLQKYKAELLWRKAVNSPTAVTAEEREQLQKAYAEEVAYADRAIGRLLDEFRTTGSYDETFVVLTADHGDEFFEHGSYSHENKLYDELVQVPLILKPPVGTQLQAVHSPPPLLDVAPTVLDTAGASLEAFEGDSLVGGSERDDTSTAVISEAQLPPEYVGAVRTSEWKYIQTPDGEELYAIEADSGECENVATSEPAVSEEFAGQLATHRKRCQGEHRQGEEVLEEGSLDERLRSLGYLE